MAKHSYKATCKDYKGKEIFFTRTSAHDYKFFWMVQSRYYGWRMENGRRVDYDLIDTDSGFSARPLAVSNHGKKDYDHVGKRDWKGEPYEQHCRVLHATVVPVELVK